MNIFISNFCYFELFFVYPGLIWTIFVSDNSNQDVDCILIIVTMFIICKW